ncbi:MAG: hypothetical protein ACPGRX_04600 [Bdellovibrionales bacterium]
MSEYNAIHDMNTELPSPPDMPDTIEGEIYRRFMGHLRHVPSGRVEIKILSAIQFTADMVDYTDAQVSKVLVDQGLRCLRAALPADYLRFADAALMRSGWEVGGPGKVLLDLKAFWDAHGDERFAGVFGDGRIADYSGAAHFV